MMLVAAQPDLQACKALRYHRTGVAQPPRLARRLPLGRAWHFFVLPDPRAMGTVLGAHSPCIQHEGE